MMPMIIWDHKAEPLPENPQTFASISLCTTVMNRLHDLRVTLPVNIEKNRNYPGKLEFVILDYNSSDGLEQWMKDEMQEHIKSGLVSYYRTTEPKYYSMTHSRNVAFKVAKGDIVNNVDADNYIGEGFPHILNKFAIIQPSKAIFAKGKRMLHGRIGFYKKEFLELGGYDEMITGYGHDDKDLLYRAATMGFKLLWYGGAYVIRLGTSSRDKGRHMKNPKIRETEAINKKISDDNLQAGKLIANEGKPWGSAQLTRNFVEGLVI